MVKPLKHLGDSLVEITIGVSFLPSAFTKNGMVNLHLLRFPFGQSFLLQCLREHPQTRHILTLFTL